MLTVCSTGAALAEPGVHATLEATVRRHVIYAEVLGRAGVYGLGYERSLTARLAVGGAASVAMLGGQQLYTLAPYVHARLLGGDGHTAFAQLGLAVVHSRLPSPVPEWDGMVDTGVGGQPALGWQWQTARTVLRATAGVAVGKAGVGAFTGLAMGLRL